MFMGDRRHRISPHDARRIAAEAIVHDSTVRRYFAGLAIRSTCRARIDAALKRLGLPEPQPRESSGGAR
jgi:hypothetical protein